MKEIFEIRSCIGILANDIKVNTAEQHIQSTFTVQQAQCKLAGNVMTAKNTLQPNTAITVQQKNVPSKITVNINRFTVAHNTRNLN